MITYYNKCHHDFSPIVSTGHSAAPHSTHGFGVKEKEKGKLNSIFLLPQETRKKGCCVLPPKASVSMQYMSQFERSKTEQKSM